MKIERVHNSTGWKSAIITWLPVLAYMAMIFALSAQQSFPQARNIDLPDKLVHFLIYMGLGAAAYRSARLAPVIRSLSPYTQAFLLAAVYGASDEYHQGFVSGRSPDIMDWVADISGAAVGLIIIAIHCKIHAIGGKQHD